MAQGMSNILLLQVAVGVEELLTHQVVVVVAQVGLELPQDSPLLHKDTQSRLVGVVQEQQQLRALVFRVVTLYFLPLLQLVVVVVVQRVLHKVLLAVPAEEILTITQALLLLRHLQVREMLVVVVLEIYLTPVVVGVVVRAQQALVVLAATAALAALAVLELQVQSVVRPSPTPVVVEQVEELEVLELVV